MSYGKSEIFRRYPLKQLGLNARTHNALERANVSTVGEILKMTVEELLDLRNVGAGSVANLDGALVKADLEAQVEELTLRVEALEAGVASLWSRVTGECK